MLINESARAQGELSLDKLKEILSYDPLTGIFIWKFIKAGRVKVGDHAGAMNRQGYLRITVRNPRKEYLAHRLAWYFCHGTWPSKHIDHINGIKTDNRIANLRDLSQSENLQNRYYANKNNQSKKLGVSWDEKDQRWKARIYKEGKSIYLGQFQTKEEASACYLGAKKVFHVLGVSDF